MSQHALVVELPVQYAAVMPSEPPRHRYIEIADDLRRQIADGTYQVGERLPTLAELKLQYRVAQGTLRDAVEVLEDEGIVEARRPKGTFVVALPGAPLPPVQEQIDDLRRRVEQLEARQEPGE